MVEYLGKKENEKLSTPLNRKNMDLDEPDPMQIRKEFMKKLSP